MEREKAKEKNEKLFIQQPLRSLLKLVTKMQNMKDKTLVIAGKERSENKKNLQPLKKT